MFKRTQTRSNLGFTLIELMIVVAIIGILAAIAIPKFADLVKKSQEGKTRGNLASMRSALSIYYGDNDGIYPTGVTADNLASLVPKYVKALPQSQVPGIQTGFPGHTLTTDVEYINEVGTSTSSHTGAWGYVNNNASNNWGAIWVRCTHNDSKGDDWNSK